MNVAGIDAHTTYLVVTVVNNTAQLVQRPRRIANSEPERLLELLEAFQPVEAWWRGAGRGRGCTIC